ncbi:MAG TPA: multicopper oxidase domain-containing protein [Usitatibacter sp.]|nr:multicopper oxidase domain-containing protein [Usitatibacter sp.]
MLRSLPAAIAFAPLLFCAPARAAGMLVEPPVFQSRNGVLDIMMVAMPRPIAGISFRLPRGGAVIHPTGWVYRICPRPPSGLSCPAGKGTASAYGGARLALEPGDVLKVRFVNRLPAIDPATLKHATDAGGSNLFLNPTNLHTHGIVTPPRVPTADDPTYGDYSYVSIFNSANGRPVAHAGHEHGPIAMDTVDYVIPIPADHPRGLYWFHPHEHGLSLNQVSEGLSGLITIGSVGDYARGDASPGRWPAANVRHLMLKETQVLATGDVFHQQDPDFCEQFPGKGEVREGSCPGKNDADDKRDFTGGAWYMTVNGQRFPNVPITSADGEIWRLVNGSANVTWDLKLVDDATHEPIAMQVVSVDGAAAHLPQAHENAGAVPCANATPSARCVSEIVMMPGSRAELWVTYRDAHGAVARPPKGASATLRMVGIRMGTGDAWPAVDLAKVRFQQRGARKLTRNEVVVARSDAAAAPMHSVVLSGAPEPACAPLPPGHRRRIFFGLSDVTRNDSFALGYEELDGEGKVVPGSQKPAPDELEQFEPSHTTICLPLGPGQAPVHETWEVVQLSTENHNFHIHQTRFRLAGSRGEPLQDNFPLGVAVPDATIADEVTKRQSGACTIAQWRSGHCDSPARVFDVPFSQPGEFVYHCHILEHEDGGMMGKIRVVASPS